MAAARPLFGDGAPIAVGVQRRHPWRAQPTERPARPAEPELAAWRIAVNAVAMFVVVFAGGLLLAATAPRLFGYDAVVVSSGSMHPAIRSGDVVITTPVDDIDLGPGSVINFERDGETIIHRIVSVTAEGFTTAGDSNASADSVVVIADDVRGVGVVRVPFAGWPTLWIERGQWVQLGALVIVSVLMLHLSRTAWLTAHTGPSEPEPVPRSVEEGTGSLARLEPYVRELTPPPIPAEARAGSGDEVQMPSTPTASVARDR